MAQNDKKKVSKTKRILSKIITVLLSAVFLFSLGCLIYVSVQVLRGRDTDLFGYRLYYVKTDSMSPTIEPGEMILSKVLKNTDDYAAADAQINVGDVVTFIQYVDGRQINNTHRIIKDVYYDDTLACYCVCTKGDNPAATNDAPVPIARLEAKMIKKVKTLSEIYDFLGSAAGIAAMIIIPMALVLVSLIWQLVVKLKQPAGNDGKSDGEKRAAREKEIAEKAVEEYKANEKRKRELAEQAVKEYIEKHK
jgi:signal peptidase I